MPVDETAVLWFQQVLNKESALAGILEGSQLDVVNNLFSLLKGHVTGWHHKFLIHFHNFTSRPYGCQTVVVVKVKSFQANWLTFVFRQLLVGIVITSPLVGVVLFGAADVRVGWVQKACMDTL